MYIVNNLTHISINVNQVFGVMYYAWLADLQVMDPIPDSATNIQAYVVTFSVRN